MKFTDNRLEKLCSDEKEMRRKRPDIEKKLRARVNALRSADNVGHLKTLDPGGDWHDLKGKRQGLWAGELSGNWRIIIRPEGVGSAVTAITVTVVEIEDYHKRP